MCDAQAESGVQNISDLVRKKIWGIFETENATKDQIKKYKRNEKELDKNCAKSRYVFGRNDLMARIIKNSRGKKKKRTEKKKKMTLEVNQDLNYTI